MINPPSKYKNCLFLTLKELNGFNVRFPLLVENQRQEIDEVTNLLILLKA